MARPENAFEIFKLLDKSNCGNCGEKTCLAFAGAVFKGQRQIGECPRLDPTIIARYAEGGPSPGVPEPEGAAHFRKLQMGIAGIDLAEAAERLGGRYADGRFTLKVLGKDFSVDARGNFYADIHVNPWVAIPFLTYIIHGEGAAPTGRWVSFREVKDGRERYPLFHKRGEQAMQQVADAYPALFDDMVHLFGGRQVERHFKSDISVVLHPLPCVPLMVCYWRPEEGMGSTLNVFFDETADRNLDIGGIFALGVGLAQMFTRIALRHGIGGEAPGPRPEDEDQ